MIHLALSIIISVTIVKAKYNNKTSCGISAKFDANCPSWKPKYGARTAADGVRVDLEDAMNNNGATCLDGSVPVFYYRAATGDGSNKFHIFFEGGGACVGVNDASHPICFESCSERADGGQGSSVDYPDVSTFNDGYLSTNFITNPLSYNWNTIYVKYCDGAMFLGDNPTLQPTNDGKLLHYRGRRIMIGVFQELINNYNFESATDVLISGCSAGGAAVYAHATYIYENFVPPGAMFLAMPDSAFFLEYEGGGDFPGVIEWIYANQNTYPSLNPACVDYFGEADAFECNFAQNNAQFINVLMFVLQSQYDSFQIACELGNPLPGAVNEYAEYFRRTFYSTYLQEGPFAELHAAFLDSCNRHCGEWNSVTTDGDTSSAAQVEWYNKHLPTDRHEWFQNETFPCLFCC